ncbi:MAG: prepilin-type N-terminal cleavage/methylation domain-containing protein [Oscillospiraceae bacterium]|nr:prepilin-type N-terminal cleavage/methylation domain-containing protein [Oscillospiraceae bacterium]
MKRTFKGFTLVECLVAMAILAIASALMASIYASVAKRNNFNHFANTSLSNQMAYIEKYENAATLPIFYGGLDVTKKTIKDPEIASTRRPPHEHVSTNSGQSAYVQVQKLDKDGSLVPTDTYSFPVDIFVMYSRDTQDDASSKPASTGSNERTVNTDYSQIFSEQNDNLRYKYVLGHTS